MSKEPCCDDCAESAKAKPAVSSEEAKQREDARIGHVRYLAKQVQDALAGGAIKPEDRLGLIRMLSTPEESPCAKAARARAEAAKSAPAKKDEGTVEVTMDGFLASLLEAAGSYLTGRR